MSDLLIRPELPADIPAITGLLEAAFPGPAEAGLVEALRKAGALTFSFVACRDDIVVGYVALSPVTLEGRVTSGVGLAPIAVAPAYQRHGIGGALIQTGLAAARGSDCRFCVVLGEPDYYGRLGFRPAQGFGLTSIYDAGDAFMAQEVVPGGLAGHTGLVRYHPAFDAL